MFNRYRPVALALASLAVFGPEAAADSGGAVAPGPPEVTGVSSPSSNTSRARGTVVRGQELIIHGRNLAGIRRVIFGGGRSPHDDVAAPTSRTTKTSAIAVVPAEARTGPLVLQGRARDRLAEIPRVVVRRPAKVKPLDIAPGNTFFYAGRQRATYAFTVARATTVGVELVNQETQAVVRSWSVDTQPGAPARISWDGIGVSGTAPVGRYLFRLAAGASASANAMPEATAGFFFADHLFPIRGPHDLGQSATNGFGGGGLRQHVGQDMFARCGTKLAAARGGKVQYAGYHAAAGNYLVIDGAGTGQDYVYMHMRRPALVNIGERVFTGQEVGEVGETGRASGCHLHFELWSAPGWYEGGRALDPLPSLTLWDSYS